MANIKISALPTATSVNNADTIPLVQSGATKKVTVDTLLDTADARVTSTLTNEFSGGSITPTMLNSFAVGSIPIKIFTVGYESRYVYFVGSVDTSAAGISGTNVPKIMFRLPVNARPKSELRFFCATMNNGTVAAVPTIGIGTDGYVTIYPSGYTYTGTSADINLAAISYFISPV